MFIRFKKFQHIPNYFVNFRQNNRCFNTKYRPILQVTSVDTKLRRRTAKFYSDHLVSIMGPIKWTAITHLTEIDSHVDIQCFSANRLKFEFQISENHLVSKLYSQLIGHINKMKNVIRIYGFM